MGSQFGPLRTRQATRSRTSPSSHGSRMEGARDLWAEQGVEAGPGRGCCALDSSADLLCRRAPGHHFFDVFPVRGKWESLFANPRLHCQGARVGIRDQGASRDSKTCGVWCGHWLHAPISQNAERCHVTLSSFQIAQTQVGQPRCLTNCATRRKFSFCTSCDV